MVLVENNIFLNIMAYDIDEVTECVLRPARVEQFFKVELIMLCIRIPYNIELVVTK